MRGDDNHQFETQSKVRPVGSSCLLGLVAKFQDLGAAELCDALSVTVHQRELKFVFSAAHRAVPVDVVMPPVDAYIDSRRPLEGFAIKLDQKVVAVRQSREREADEVARVRPR